MHVYIRPWRWIALVLYLALIACLALQGLQGNIPDGIWPLQELVKNYYAIPLSTIAILLLIMFGSQLLFLTGAGTVNLCRPVQRYRMIVPVLMGATMLSLLVAGIWLSLMEVTEMEWMFFVFWPIVLVNWLVWANLFFQRYQHADRYTATKSMLDMILKGSLASLIITIPSHIFTSRRGECMAGMYTSIGVTSSLAVMLWSFGPGIILLFLAEMRRKELEKEKVAATAVTDENTIREE